MHVTPSQNVEDKNSIIIDSRNDYLYVTNQITVNLANVNQTLCHELHMLLVTAAVYDI